VVQPRDGEPAPTLADLDAHSRTQLAAYKTLRHLVLVDEIQRSPSGKPDYPWATTLAKDAISAPA